MADRLRSLLVRPKIWNNDEPGIVNRVAAEDAGWRFLNMEVRRLHKGEAWAHDTGDYEASLVLLGGCCGVVSNKGEWPSIGRRADVFSGMPYALYLPRGTTFTLTALTHRLEVAHCWLSTGTTSAM